MTLNVRDRTREFTATVESLFGRRAARTGQNYEDPLLGSGRGGARSPSGSSSEVMRKAVDINNGIQRVGLTLERLSKRKQHCPLAVWIV